MATQAESGLTVQQLTDDELTRAISHAVHMGGCGQRQGPSLLTLAQELARRVARPDESVHDVIRDLFNQLADHLNETQSA